MPVHEVQAPDGQIMRVEAPEGASEQDILSFAAQSYRPKPPEAPESFLRQSADIPVGVVKGVATGIRMITDSFGADNPISGVIRGTEDYLNSILSAQAKKDQAEVSRIMKEAENKGILDQVMAGLKAFSVAPVDMLSQAAGTVAPALVGGLAGAALRVGATIGGVGTGAVMGAGSIKGSIYEATKEELAKTGISKEKIEEAATKAQEYGGENLDQILLGAGLGGLSSITGVEGVLIPSLAKNILNRATQKSAITRGLAVGAKEAVPEALQGGQEQYAQNVALGRQGFDIDPWRGVAGQATLEGVAGFGLGAPLGAMKGPTEIAPAVNPMVKPEDERIGLDQTIALQEPVPPAVSPPAAINEPVGIEPPAQVNPVDAFHPAIAGQNLLALPAPAKLVEPEPMQPSLQNPLGAFTYDNFTPDQMKALNDLRKADGKPKLPQSFSIEDIADLSPAKGVLDALVTAKSGYNGEQVTFQQLIDIAKLKNIDITTQGFKDFLRRATGTEDLAKLSPPQLFAATKALDSLQPFEEMTILPTDVSNATHYTPQQYNKAIGGIDLAFKEVDNKPLGRQAMLTEIKDFTGLSDRDAERILQQAIRDGHIEQRDEVRNVNGEQKVVPSFMPAQNVEQLPGGMDIRQQKFKQADGSTKEKFVYYNNDEPVAMFDDLYQAERYGITQQPDNILDRIVKSYKDQRGLRAQRYGALAEREIESRKNPEINRAVTTKKGEEGATERLGELGIDYVEFKPEVKEAVPEIMKVLAPALKKLGLSRVGLKLVDTIDNGGSDGFYFKGIITLALDQDNPLGAMRHEVVHALKALGVFTPSELKTLEKFAKKALAEGRFFDQQMQDLYKEKFLQTHPDLTGFDEYMQEEVMAEAFRYFSGTKPPAGFFQNLMYRLNAMFRAIGNAFRSVKLTTPEQIFADIESGKIGSRTGANETGQPRYSLRNQNEPRTGNEGKTGTLNAEAGRLPERGGLSGSTRRVQGKSGVSDEAKSLNGMPTEFTILGQGVVSFGSFKPAVDAANKYMAGKPYYPPINYAKVDPIRAKRIAQSFNAMIHDPKSPKVLASYNAMIDETLAQYQAIKDTGLKIDFIQEGMNDPYAASPRLAILDAVNNNHLWVFPTDFGFGDANTNLDEADNPMLRFTDEYVNGKQLRANDVFRIVHDYFGHIKDGVGFRADGEENAWRSHVEMYSPLAQPAMTAETRGQNSWVNFGPHGDFNKTASAADTVYAPQKVGLMPMEFVNDGRPKNTDYGDIYEKPKTTSGLVRSVFRPSDGGNEGVYFKPKKPSASTFYGVHYGKEKTRTLESGRYGTGLKGAERKRLDNAEDKRILNRVYFYIENSDGSMPVKESGLGTYIHAQKFSNVLAPGKEMDAIRKEADGDPNKFESKIIDAGYDGYAVPSMGMMVILDNNVPVEYVGTESEKAPAGALHSIRPPSGPVNEPLITKVGAQATTKQQVTTAYNETIAAYKSSDLREKARIALLDPSSSLAQRLAASAHFDMNGTLRADMVYHAKAQGINLIKNGMVAGNIVLNKDGSLEVKDSKDNLAAAAKLADSIDKNPYVRATTDKGRPVSGRQYVGEIARILRGADIIADDAQTRKNGLAKVAQAKALFKQVKGMPLTKQRVALVRQMAKLRSEGLKESKVNREKQVNKAQIAWAEHQLQSVPEVKEILRIWKAVNTGLVDLHESVGILSKEKADEFRGRDRYVPLFKAREDLEDSVFNFSGTGSKSVAKGHKLEGSEAIRNIWENVDKQYASMVATAYENQTRKVASEQLISLSPATGSKFAEIAKNPKDSRINLRYLEDGKIVNIIVENPNDVAAFQMMNYELGPIMKAVSGLSKTLRVGALLNPMFWLKQLIRDPIHASIVGGTGIITPLHSARGFIQILTNNSEEAKILARRGVIGSFDSTLSMAQYLKDVGKEKATPNGMQNMFHKLMRIHEASDAATRVEIFKKARAYGIKKGMTPEDAENYGVFKAREAINFAVHGNSAILNQLRHSIPFFSAAMASLDTVYRAYTGFGLSGKEKAEAKAQFKRRAAMMFLMSMAYAIMLQGDDEYEKLPDYVKDNNWLIPNPAGKGFLKVATPFEVGFLFKTIPEVVVRSMMGTSTGKEAIASIQKGLIQNLPGGGVIFSQAIKPAVEVITNHSFFTGNPIESVGDQGKSIANRGQRASETAKMLSRFGLDKIGLSPAKIDHLIQGYFAEIGTFVTSAADTVIYEAEGKTPPAKNFESMQALKPFLTDRNVNKAVSDFYEIEKAARETVADLNDMKKKGMVKEIKELISDEEKRKQIAIEPMLRKTMEGMAKIRAQIGYLRENEAGMTPEARRDRINELTQFMNQYAAQGVKAAKSIGLK